MNFLTSQFGAYAEAANLQAMIDAREASFDVPVWTKWFKAATPQTTLNYVTVIGKKRLDAAASLVSRDGRTPLRARPNLAKMYGEVPAIKVMKSLNEDDYRSFLTLQTLQIADAVKKAQMFSFIFDDIQSTTNSVNRKLDYMVLEGMSTGFITVTSDNNPDGIVLAEPIDLLMPAVNFGTVVKDWTDSTADIPTDITNMMRAIKQQNVTGIVKMIVDDWLWTYIVKNPALLLMLKSFHNPGSNAKYVATLDSINQMLTANRMPYFEIIDVSVPIEKDGQNIMTRPFKKENVLFLPDGMLGEIKNALAIEELTPVTQVSYVKRGNILVSKWFSNEPFGEFTKSEWNAFPSFDQIDSMFILQTDEITPEG